MKDRLFKLAVGGLIAIPTAYNFAEQHARSAEANVLSAFVYTLPLIICSVALLYLSEHLGMMRAGRYIRCFIEREIADDRKPGADYKRSKIKGWETWLEEYPSPAGEPKRRTVDKYLLCFFHGLYLIYYVAAALLGIQMAHMQFGVAGSGAAIGVYTSVGILFGFFLVLSWSKATSTT